MATGATRVDERLGLSRLAAQSDYWWTVHRRTWRGIVATAFLSPLFYVLAMGVLLGGLIDARTEPQDLAGAPSYLAFVVPGLVAAHAMQVAVAETTWPVTGRIKWDRSYRAMLATPLTPADLVAAQLAFVVFRLLLACGVFVLALTPFGVFATWWGPPAALAVQVLVGLAFAACVYAVTVRLPSEEGFAVLYRLGVFPMFLFSGAFFPVDGLGPVLAWAARLTPLWHGVELTRMLTLDSLRPGAAAVHVAVLVALLLAGWRASVTGLTRRMVA